jgi:hypothetical protein
MDESIVKKLVGLKDQVTQVIEEVRGCDPVSGKASQERSSRWLDTTMLVTNPVLVEWLRDAGLSSYEIDLLSEPTLAGITVRDRLIDGLKIGVQVAVLRMRHDPEENGEVVAAWAEDRDVELSPEWDSIGKGSARFCALLEERAKLLEAEAKAKVEQAMSDPVCESALRHQSARLKGEAKGIRYVGTLLLVAAERARHKGGADTAGNSEALRVALKKLWEFFDEDSGDAKLDATVRAALKR